ncbi:hypothetical protein [Microbulbifer hydrolyticus]|uniref:Uncharacterized protein n=1 Tax=Microbulbifer hydrolyticus TaxID=48074 RepID=A0A6P1T7R0_9GAMM|nr:hypothetical protein [Microbulbifer hydrolyticus]MBB5210712.1 hypothetical protein [Microbulbifer hydrolyticus]QHQ38834.1 hypothetical protein GTQ55_07445 [Microbulbifer hydrolyticus]
MNKSIKRGVAVSCLLTLMLNLTACGYFLYPERKGQSGGRVDPVVVILDGAGLLFGILPGVVAFAVDFTNGTIYLPAGGSSAIDRHISAVDQDVNNEKAGALLEEGKPVIDQNGQAWIELPLEAVTGEKDVENTSMEQVRAALGELTGQQVAAADIVWLQDLAALSQARAAQQATAAR